MWFYPLCILCVKSELYRLIYLELANYSFCSNDFFKHLTFPGSYQPPWLPSLHTGIFYRNPLLLLRCALSDTPAARGLCPVIKVTVVLSSASCCSNAQVPPAGKKKMWQIVPIPINQENAGFSSKLRGRLLLPTVLVTVLFQLCVNSIFLWCVLCQGYASRVSPE